MAPDIGVHMDLTMFGMNVVLAEVKKEEEVSPGGIHLPGNVSKGNLRFGIVECAGPGEDRHGKWVENPVKKDQKVIFNITNCVPMNIDGKTRLFTYSDNIVGKL
jgi:co-chaperonin GroES (HSP10)